jgi:UDP-N-acetylglucosamine 2-epimerase (non-hydrolysing)
VLAASLAAFYRRIPVVHVEAGLRTGDLQAPWPEEMNRCVATLIAALHCAPSLRAAENLAAAGVAAGDICLTGNTVIDALLWTRERESRRDEYWRGRFPQLEGRIAVLVTAHRRESFGPGLRDICLAVAELARRFPEMAVVFPVHLNPLVQAPIRELLTGRPNIWLLPPASYPEFVWLLDRAALVLTDSGGVQEEAPALGKPVLVLREVTERPEAVEAGFAELVGTDPERIVAAASRWLDDPARLDERGPAFLPYGDGRASQRVAEAILRRFAGRVCESCEVDAVVAPVGNPPHDALLQRMAPATSSGSVSDSI